MGAALHSAVITGFPRQAQYLTRLLNANARSVRAWYCSGKPLGTVEGAARAGRADALIQFGGPRPNGLLQSMFERRGKPVIVLWAGTDVMELAQRPRALEPLLLERFVHWACAQNLAAELAGLGISARYVPVASALVPSIAAPLPSNFTVLAFLTKPRRDFYGQQVVWQAARALPDARFIVVGAGGAEPEAPANVAYIGEIGGMDAQIDDASAILRFTEHDGLSVMVIEALARGRHVVWNHALPGVSYASSSVDAVETVVKLHALHAAGKLRLNETGMQYASAAHAPRNIAEGVARALEDAIQSAQTLPGSQRRLFALSGQEVFCSRVAANCRTYRDDIETALLATSTKSDIAASAFKLVKSDVWYRIGEPSPPRPLETIAAVLRKRRLIHWLGPDVEALKRDERLRRRMQSDAFTHLAQSADVSQQLNGVGIKARIVPLAAAANVGEVRPLPATFTLLLYVPRERPELYGRCQYEWLMQELADAPVHYIIVGGGAISVPRGVSNEQLDWVPDLAGVYDRSTVLVRFTKTDSFSTMVVEALMRGRFVLWSNEFPFATRVTDYHDLAAQVRDLLERHARGSLTPQIGAATAMIEQYSPVRCLTLLFNGHAAE
jgi:hypothetical protein